MTSVIHIQECLLTYSTSFAHDSYIWLNMQRMSECGHLNNLTIYHYSAQSLQLVQHLVCGVLYISITETF